MTNTGKLVLGVDDAPENLLILKAVLGAAGYAFVGVSNGPECIALVLRGAPKLILLDIQMPEMDGFAVCRKLRTVPAGKHVPVAFLTARKTAQDVTEGLAAGGNDFILKPFDRTKLIERVHHWAQRQV